MTGGATDGPATFPRLQPGLTVPVRPTRRSPALQRLVLSETGAWRDSGGISKRSSGELRRPQGGGSRIEGETLWIDARNEVSTYEFYERASSRR
ncbi:hypothetical protein [Halorussus halophilus]|uniref:hypothetical protein n=1 Tax=Halorussus halophilus TaxID=2650975 RepID=UPI001301410E|nr:hypothetical protein [Halorussus halophilus]